MIELVVVCLMPVILVARSEASSLFNFPACQDCSSRKDIPCRIEKINDRCYHTEFMDKWPGKPRDLTSREIEIDEDRTSASFTWKPPYDASVDSLSGFFLTVNINIQLLSGMASLGPFCFHANLSGTDWRAIPNPHSVLFHFDCVTTKPNKETHVRLDVSSSPMPNRNAGFVESQVTIGTVIKQKRHQRAIIGRHRWRTSKERMEDLKINYTVTGNRVYVLFGPLSQKVQYYNLCLSPCSSAFTACFMEQNVSEDGVREAVFDNVKPDNYTIMIHRNIEETFFVTKCFTVAPPPVPAENSPLILLIIILGCLLFVVIATTIMFFCLRKSDRRHFPGCIEKCKRTSQYEQTLQNIPNNTADSPEDVEQELLFLFTTEHPSFITVAQKLANMVNEWTHFKVDLSTTMCDTDQEVETKISGFTNQKVVILLTEGTKQLLLDTQKDWFPTQDKTPQDKYLYRIFSILLSRQRQGQCLVSLCSVTFISKVFEDLQTFFLVNTEKGIQNLSIDVKEFRGFLESLDPGNSQIPDDLVEHDDVDEFLSAVRAYMEERSAPQSSYQGSPISYDIPSPNMMPIQTEQHYPTQHRTCEREDDIKQWVQSQQPVQGYVHPGMTTHNYAPVYQPTSLQCFENIHGHQRLRNPAKRGQHMPRYQSKGHRNYIETRTQCAMPHIDDQNPIEEWEEPESDTESVTMSTILQQTMELNQDYMVRMKENVELINGQKG